MPCCQVCSCPGLVLQGSTVPLGTVTVRGCRAGCAGMLACAFSLDDASKVLSWWGFPHGAVLELPFPEAMAVVRVTAPAWPQLFLEMCEIPSFDPSPPLN